MGAVFEVPLARASEFGRAAGHQDSRWTRVPRTFAGSRASDGLTDVQRTGDDRRGAERDGLPEEFSRRADHVARIPIETHSLNAAMAATIALYELTTRRIAAA